MAAYPSIAIALASFEERPRDYQTIRTEFEAGYVQTRAKNTTAPRSFRFLHQLASAADVTTFNTFWEARKGGAEAFDFTDPRTGGVISCRFVGERPGYVPRAPNKEAYDIGPVSLEEAL